MPISLPSIIYKCSSIFIHQHRGSSFINSKTIGSLALQPCHWKREDISSSGYGNLAFENTEVTSQSSGLTFGGRWAHETGVGTGRSLCLRFDDAGDRKLDRLKKSNLSYDSKPCFLSESRRSDEDEQSRYPRQPFGQQFKLSGIATNDFPLVSASRNVKPIPAKRGVVSLEKTGVVILKKTDSLGKAFGGVPIPAESTNVGHKKFVPPITVDGLPRSPRHKRVELLREVKKSNVQSNFRLENAGDVNIVEKESGQAPLKKEQILEGIGEASATDVHKEKRHAYKELKEDRDKRENRTDGTTGFPSKTKVKGAEEILIEKARARVVKLSDILHEKNKEKIIDSWVAHTVQFAGSDNSDIEDKEREGSERPLNLVGKQMDAVLKEVELKVQEEMSKSLLKLSSVNENEIERSPDEPRRGNDRNSETSSVVTILHRDGSRVVTPSGISPDTDKQHHGPESSKATSVKKKNLGVTEQPSWSGAGNGTSARKQISTKCIPAEDASSSDKVAKVPFFTVERSGKKVQTLDKRDLLKSSMTLDLAPRDYKIKSSRKEKSAKPADHSSDKKHDCGATKSLQDKHAIGSERKPTRSLSADCSRGVRGKTRIPKVYVGGRSVDGGSVKGGASRSKAVPARALDGSKEGSVGESWSDQSSGSIRDTSRPASSGSSKGACDRSSSESSRDSASGTKPKLKLSQDKLSRWK